MKVAREFNRWHLAAVVVRPNLQDVVGPADLGHVAAPKPPSPNLGGFADLTNGKQSPTLKISDGASWKQRPRLSQGQSCGDKII